MGFPIAQIVAYTPHASVLYYMALLFFTDIQQKQ